MMLVLALLPAVVLGHMMTGDIRETTVSATDEPVLFAVKAIKEQFAKKNSGLPFSGGPDLVEIIHARTQLVAGEKLYLTLLMKGGYLCDVTVWYRVWQQGASRLQITDGPTCQKTEQSASSTEGTPPSWGLPPLLVGGGGGGGGGGGVPGGVHDIRLGGISDPRPLPQPDHPDHDSVHRALSFATCAVNDRLDSLFALTLAFPFGVRYTQQVTSGMTYRFYNVPLVPTTCRNQGCAQLDLSTCSINIIGRQIRMCRFRVQYRAWMVPQYNLTDFAC